ncbi:MAG: cupin domain-containing protein [Erysipelotrichaceae bacterium]|nr:cupin domain-containing protein [Erysipelotrichaceae bacterium]
MADTYYIMEELMQRFSLDTNTMKWDEQISRSTGQVLLKKHLLRSDEDTGMSIEIITYPKGYINKWHTHPCAHAMYVLEGRLRTDDGKTYGPGEFVYFPEGDVMRHGATEEEDCVILFITNKAFEMIYADKEND